MKKFSRSNPRDGEYLRRFPPVGGVYAMQMRQRANYSEPAPCATPEQRRRRNWKAAISLF